MLSNKTLAGTKEMGIRITAYCNACHHSNLLDLDALIERLGPDHGALHHDLVPKLKCISCDSKRIALILSSNSAHRASGG